MGLICRSRQAVWGVRHEQRCKRGILNPSLHSQAPAEPGDPLSAAEDSFEECALVPKTDGKAVIDVNMHCECSHGGS